MDDSEEPPRSHVVRLLVENPTVASEIDGMTEHMAASFTEYLRHGLAAGNVARDALPAVIDSLCGELIEFFLTDARQRGGWEAFNMDELEEYTEVVVGRVRSHVRAAMGVDG